MFRYVVMVGSGTMVSAAVLSALPVEVPPRLLEMLLVTAFACAFELSELLDAEAEDEVETAE